MDDVDAVQAQIARNMLASGDWVTARLNGVAYLEKAPLIYWMMATSYRVFGVHDRAARLPLALAVVLLCWVTYRFGRWAFDDETGLYAGLVLSTSVGLFLFTRILIPDAMVTLSITGSIWALLYLLEPDGERSPFVSFALGFCLGAGLLLKGLIAVVFPGIAGLAYMGFTGRLFSWVAWRRLRVGFVAVVALAVAVPWHWLAMRHNPPYFAFTMRSVPGEYHGFFWFYFFNEHLLRFLNLRYPHDYNTVPRLWFWLLNLVWVFPWSVYLLSVLKLGYQPTSRGGRVRLMLLCWVGAVMLFFTFSTTQEYYSLPTYPALALLLACALHTGGQGVRVGTGVLLSICALLSSTLVALLVLTWRLPAPGDISQALTQHPELYTLSLGHIRDLTLGAFAYLKLPVALAAFSFAVCTLALVMVLRRRNVRRSVFAISASMIIFFQAARIALIRFDSYLGSYPLSQSLLQSPPGNLIEANSYYAFSSVFFYSNRTALLLNGRNNNLEYGSYAPDAPDVFIGDDKFASLWSGPSRWYLLAYGSEMPHLEQVAGTANLFVVARSAGNYLLTNHPLP
jgi:Dolichyl-phosphate-mannose-protein mannosyltransferase